jgi:AcrR family transcriptional regulator
VRAARREKLLDAAETLFVAHGFRATAIEAIAEAAGISKVTVYGYFRDKDAVFVAVAERLAARMETAVRAALAGAAPFPAPVAEALAAKHRIVLEGVHSSPFASELFQAKAAHVAQRFAALDAVLITLLTTALAQAGRKTEWAAKTAELLFAAANGIAGRARDAETLTVQIDRLVRALVVHDAEQSVGGR